MSDHYTADERRAQAKKIARTREAATEALRVGAILARSAAAEGIPETVIAEQLGVNRMTVRNWLGKR